MLSPARTLESRPTGRRRRLASPVAGLLLVGLLAGCTTGSSTEAAAITTPAGVTTGAAPVAPPSDIPTWANGDDTSTGVSEDAGGAAADPEVVVSYHEWNSGDSVVEVGGYLNGVIESGGRCSVTLTRAGSTLTGSSVASEDATTTACAVVVVDVPVGSAGEWTGVLRYESDQVETSSAPFTVTVR
jgi:hypothetical protein